MHSGQSHHEWGQCEGNENKILAFYLLCNKDSSNPRWCEKSLIWYKYELPRPSAQAQPGKRRHIMNQLMGDNLHKHYRRGKHPQAIKKGGVALTGAPWPGEVQYVWDGGRLLMMTCCSVKWQMWAMLLHLRMSVGMVNKLEVKRSYY